MSTLAPLEHSACDHVRAWIRAGYLVGKGRRGTDALVLRLPMERLRKEGILDSTGEQSLGQAAKETRRVGYSIDLLPSKEAKKLRAALRRVSLLLTKLSLSLQCFGAWMPHVYWDLFWSTRKQMLDSATLAHEHIVMLATQQRSYLLEGGGLQESLDFQQTIVVRQGRWAI